jgi:hypothetical protein
MVITLYAVFFLEVMDKYKKEILRKSSQHRRNSLTGQCGEKQMKIKENFGSK